MKRNIYSLLLGMGAGIIMAVILLFSMLETGFLMQGISLWLCMIVAAALPLCLNLFSSKVFQIILSQVTMVLVSFLITVIYFFYVSNTGSSYTNIFHQGMWFSTLLHSISLFVTVIVWFIERRGKEK